MSTHRRLNAEDERLGRYHGPARIVCVGDPAVCARYVTLGRNVLAGLRHSLALGGITEGMRAATLNGVSILAMYKGGMNQIIINASGVQQGRDLQPLGGYQFYTTSSNVEWAILDNPNKDFCPGGSAIYIPTPVIKLKDGAIDYDKTLIYAYPTGSTTEESNNKKDWKYVGPTPTRVVGLVQLMYSLFKIENSWQVNGIPEYVYYGTRKNEAGEIKTFYRLFGAWVQPEAQINGYNAFYPSDYVGTVDIAYDASPGLIAGSIQGKAPDTDWFGRPCVQVVGDKPFIIMYDSNGDWYCWPADAGLNVSFYEAEYATYGDQAYKANIIPQQAKKVTPIYPEWVSKAVVHRDLFKSKPGVALLEPRYSFAYNSKGTKAISLMVERKEHDGDFSIINYTPEGLDYYVEYPIAANLIPTESVIEPLKLDRSADLDMITDQQKIQEDRFGFVELSLKIGIEDDGDFSFDVSILSSNSPDALKGEDKGVITNIAYARSLRWGQRSELGFQLTNDTYSVDEDDVLSVWIELFWHKRQKDLVAAFDGEPSINVPSKTKASFYKHTNFSTLLFSIPLSQSHGKGYSYNWIQREGVLPAPPHDFVWCPDQTLVSLYPYEDSDEDHSKSLYHYSAKLEHLELSSLSFYYTVRVVEKKRAELPIVDRDDRKEAFRIQTNSKTYCAVCVMGRVYNDYWVGSEAISNDWIIGWMRNAGADALDEDEEKTPVDFLGNLRGIGAILGGTGFAINSFNHFSWSVSDPSIALKYEYYGIYPWWMNGLCATYTKMVLDYAFLESTRGNPHTYITGDPPEPVTRSFSSPGSLLEMTEESMHGLAEFIWDFHDNHYFTTTIISGSSTTELKNQYATNPFPASNLSMTKELFAESAKGYLWGMVKRQQEFVIDHPDFLIIDDPSPGDYQNLNYRSFSVLPNGGGFIVNQQQNLLIARKPFSEGYEKKYVVRDVNLGTLYYNEAIKKHFYVDGMNLKAKILVTPEGHISYSKRDLYDVTKEYSAQAIYYLNYTPTTYTLDVNTEEPFTVDDIEWKAVEGLSWFYGKVKTKHIYMYNLAYRDSEEGEIAKKGIKSEESYGVKYAEEDFKPDFKVISSGGMYYIYPLYSDDGRPKTVNRFGLPKESGVNYTALSLPPTHDPRPKLTELRLSPLFF